MRPKTINHFMKQAEEQKAESIRVILDYKLKKDSIVNRILGRNKGKTIYEAIVASQPKVRLIQNLSNMSQLEAIAYTGHQVDSLEKELPNIPIQFQNREGEDIEQTYHLMLQLADKVLNKKYY